MGPTTRTSTTCTLAAVGGITNEGFVAGVEVPGTPKSVTLTLKRNGKTLGQASYEPDYTPDRCGFVAPHVALPRTPG